MDYDARKNEFFNAVIIAAMDWRNIAKHLIIFAIQVILLGIIIHWSDQHHEVAASIKEGLIAPRAEYVIPFDDELPPYMMMRRMQRGAIA